MFRRFLILAGLLGAALAPLACSTDKSNPSAPVTVYYVPITDTPTITGTPTSTGTSTFTNTRTFTPTVTNTPTATLHIPHAYLGQWSVTSPAGLGVNSAGTTVWVTAGAYINVFNGSGTYLSGWGGLGAGNGQFLSVTGMAVNSTATTLYVTDTGNSRVQYFSPTGTYLGQWGTSGSGSGQFSSPNGIAINGAGTTIYVSDTSNYRIQYFTGTGTYLGQWTYGGMVPYGIAVNSAGTTVYVSDQIADNILVFDGTGNFHFLIGGPGSSDGSFANPALMAFDPSGANMVVADKDNNRFQEFVYSYQYDSQSDGSFSGFAFSQPLGVAMDSSLNVYVSDTNNNRVVKFGP